MRGLRPARAPGPASPSQKQVKDHSDIFVTFSSVCHSKGILWWIRLDHVWVADFPPSPSPKVTRDIRKPGLLEAIIY